jgi:hypothetical protein
MVLLGMGDGESRHAHGRTGSWSGRRASSLMNGSMSRLSSPSEARKTKL